MKPATAQKRAFAVESLVTRPRHETDAFVWDGFGINGPDEYRSRVATVDRLWSEYGPFLAHTANAYPRQVKAAQELLNALDREHGEELGVDTAAAMNRLSALLAELGE